MSSLSNDQESIVHAPIGEAMQVLASAGSGKTRVLTERIRYVLKETKKDGVIALTFTNKAAEEMKNRLQDIEDLDERCWIGTIHSVAQRILDQYGYTIGLPTELHIYEREHDRKTVFLQSLRGEGIDIDAFLDIPDENLRKERDRIINKYMELFSIVKHDLLNEEEIKQRYNEDENFLSIYQSYQKALLDSGGIDFDDILVYANQILTEQSWCGKIYQAKYKHICVDEAQDMNKAQYEFVKVLCAEHIKSVLMVGDPNQMIYGFNGSSSDYFCENFIEDFFPRKYELKRNYRSSKAIINLANKLKPNSQNPSDFAFQGKYLIQDFENEELEAIWICDKIKELCDLKNDSEIEGEIELNNMVVIARNRFVFPKLENHLQEKNISYFLNKGERQVEPDSVFGKVLDLGIRLKINSKNWIDGKKLCNVLKIQSPKSWGRNDFLTLFSEDVKESDIPFLNIQINLLKAIQELDLDDPKILSLHSRFNNEFNLLAKSEIDHMSESELERSLQELDDFKNYWVMFKKRNLGDSLLSFRNAMSLGQLHGDYNPTGLTLSTVHTMKGLEKDIVFLIGMCEGIFPDYRETSVKKIESERNNAYVAVTRAKRWIYITYPKQRIMPWGKSKTQSPSRFINELQIS
jgi:DNA helicase-2/ATP-dependent DNA helicase PcrA